MEVGFGKMILRQMDFTDLSGFIDRTFRQKDGYLTKLLIRTLR